MVESLVKSLEFILKVEMNNGIIKIGNNKKRGDINV